MGGMGPNYARHPSFPKAKAVNPGVGRAMSQEVTLVRV